MRFGFVSGPVLDTRGRVVGIVGFDLAPAEGGDLYIRSGHPLVYPVELFSKYLKNPPRGTGEASSEGGAWLGVFTQPLTDDFARYWNLEPTGGLIVSTVVPGSPAQASGLQEGDVIVNFDGTPIRARQDRDVMGFTKLVRDTGAGNERSLVLAARTADSRRSASFRARRSRPRNMKTTRSGSLFASLRDIHFA